MTQADGSQNDMTPQEFEKNLKASQMPDTRQVPLSDFSQLFKVPENKQNVYATFTEAFERYKVNLDVIKWLIGTVGLTAISYFINASFQDRRQGIEELQFYNTYASEKVVFADNPRTRLLLAQFYANVTPSKTLKNGWKSYLIVVQAEVDSTIEFKKRKDADAARQAIKDTITPQGKAIYHASVREADSTKSLLNIPVSQELAIIDTKDNPLLAQNINSAASYEIAGFKALLSKNYSQAMESFLSSDNAYPGFHSVYEIATYLNREKANFEKDKNWNKIYKDILVSYSWKMPQDVKSQLQQLLNNK